jgi:serine/threonine protein kinase
MSDAWDSQKYGGWYRIRDLGEGGQGKVYLVRSPQSLNRQNEANGRIQKALEPLLSRTAAEPWRQVEALAEGFRDWQSADSDSSEFGALKVFKEPTGDPAEIKRARQRFENEVKALKESSHPSLLKLLAQGDGWMVTEYLPGGTLAKQITRGEYTGDPLAAMEALRPAVEAVAVLHEGGVVHRDLKPDNIFVASDGRLVVGDCGIVFFENGTTRVTDTWEKVGTTDWMPGWAHGMRPDEVPAKFDVFALGKILWCMVSDRPKLPLWYHNEPPNILREKFENTPELKAVQRILDNTVRERREQCEPESARDLLALLNNELANIKLRAERLSLEVPMPCRVCRKGVYKRFVTGLVPGPDRYLACLEKGKVGNLGHIINLYDPSQGQVILVAPFICKHCGHVEFFSLGEREIPPAWKE